MTRARLWALCAAAAACAGLLVASTMTVLDWRLNPGGVFHTPGGTHWEIVWHTWISWFLPVAAATLLVCLPIAAWATTRRSTDNRNEETG